MVLQTEKYKSRLSAKSAALGYSGDIKTMLHDLYVVKNMNKRDVRDILGIGEEALSWAYKEYRVRKKTHNTPLNLSVEKVAEYIEAGHTQQEAAAHFGCSQSRINYFNRQAINIMLPEKDKQAIWEKRLNDKAVNFGYDGDTKAMLHDLYIKRNLRKSDIRNMMQVSFDALNWAYAKYHIVKKRIRTGGGQNKFQYDAKAIHDYLIDHTQADAAAHFGCSQGTISRIARSMPGVRYRDKRKQARIEKIENKEAEAAFFSSPSVSEFDAQRYLDDLNQGICRNACLYCGRKNRDKNDRVCKDCKWKYMYLEHSRQIVKRAATQNTYTHKKQIRSKKKKVNMSSDLLHKKFLRPDEVAGLMGWSTSHVYNLIKIGDIKATKVKPYRIPIDEVQSLLTDDDE